MTYQQPPQPPYGKPPYGQPYSPRPPMPKKKTSAWVWVLAGFGALLVLGAIGSAVGGNETTTAASTTKPAPAAPLLSAAPAVAPTTPTPAVTEVAIPDVVGKNGAVASDELKKAGFTNVTYGSATPGVDLVLNLSNWTVKAVEPGPGTVISTDMAVVLTMTKNNR